MLDFVINVAKQAGEIIMQYYGESDFHLKDNQSPVTIADLESSKLIISLLKMETNFPVLSEARLVEYSSRKL